MAERRVAVTIKGGVSLGAYEAGVLTQTLRLIDFNNRQPGATFWYIDALAGASAGSVTAALVAIALVNGKIDNLGEVWVNALSLDGLRPISNQFGSDYNLLDAARLDQLADRYVVMPQSASRHPALRPGSARVDLRFCVSRLDPKTTGVQTLDGTQLMVQEYADSATFTIQIGANDSISVSSSGVASRGYSSLDAAVSGQAAIAAFVQAAMASGTFPFAFAPRDLRFWDAVNHWGDDYCIDGGLFDNDPVGNSISLAHQIDWYSDVTAGFNDADRRFLIVHTEPFKPAQPMTPSNPDLLGLFDPLTFAKRVGGEFLSESQTSGVRGIVEVNSRFQQRDSFLKMLATQLRFGANLAIGDDLVGQLADWRGIKPEQVEELQKWLIPDLKDTNPEVYAIVEQLPNDQIRERFTNVALAFDLMLDVADKVALTPILVVPDNPLAGNPLYGFAGFLVPALRQRDFQQGMYDAWQRWSKIAGTDAFIMPAGDPAYPMPELPPDAATVMAQNQTTYQNGLDDFFTRVDSVIRAFIASATQGAALGGLERALLNPILDYLAHHALSG